TPQPAQPECSCFFVVYFCYSAVDSSGKVWMTSAQKSCKYSAACWITVAKGSFASSAQFLNHNTVSSASSGVTSSKACSFPLVRSSASIASRTSTASSLLIFPSAHKLKTAHCRSSVSPVSPCLCVFHRASIMVINFLFSIMTDSFLLGIVSITLNPEKVKSYSQKMGYFLLFFLKDQKPTVRIIVDAPLLPFIPDTAVKGHDCSHDAIDLFRTFCLRRFDITCRIGVHHHI